MTRIIRARALVHIGKPTQRRAKAEVSQTQTVRLCKMAGGETLRVRTGQVPVLIEFSPRSVVGVAKVDEVVGGIFIFAELALMGSPSDYVGLFPAIGAMGDEILTVGLCRHAVHPRIPALQRKDLQVETLWRKMLRAVRGAGWRP